MDVAKITGALLKTAQPVDKERQKAEKTAGDFEAMFVRQLVGSLRQTAAGFGDDGGMFGGGPGADTYADWFDQNVADSIRGDHGIGIAQRIVADLERWHQVHGKDAQAKVADKAQAVAKLAGRDRLAVVLAQHGGIDVAR